ncbi:MAG TPA: hypothetical protein VFM71_03255 [Gemmatimonadaceae bacterium]|nr:hypothetical protein [Gemmatimonadaceae bacterium]
MTARKGIVLPVVLAVLVALMLLSALALSEAMLDWRVARFADDAVRARAAAMRGLAAVDTPPDLATLCVSGPLAVQERVLPQVDGTDARVLWRQLGGGVVRAEVEGTGVHGARHRAWALLVPDSTARVMGLLRCPDALRLVPVPGRATDGHPEG